MAFAAPVPGLVIRYSYLWASEHARGREEGVKDRPCAVILAIAEDAGGLTVKVLPISHTPPADLRLAVEIPAATKRRLGLDDDRSWVVLTEANRFIWPSPDLRPLQPGDATSVAYSPLPLRNGFQDNEDLSQEQLSRDYSISPKNDRLSEMRIMG